MTLLLSRAAHRGLGRSIRPILACLWGGVLGCSVACGAPAPAQESISERPRSDVSPSPRRDRPTQSPAGPAAPVVPVVQGPAEALLDSAEGPPVRVRIEVAIRESDRERGLMHRRHLDSDAGMLFVFEEMEHLSFWMENTFIPLDVLFLDDDLRIVGIVTDTVPLTQDPIEVEGPSQYVLEVNAGFTRGHGIEAGGQVELIGVSLPAGAP